MRRKRWLWFLAGMLGLLLVAQVATYILFADASRPAVLVGFLPQYTHCKGMQFDFVCVAEETWASLSHAQQRALDRALARHFKTVYHREPEIPASTIAEGGAGLRNGCIIGWKRHRTGVFWFSATCQDYVGNMAASGSDAVFIWFLGFWIHAWTSAGYIV